MASSERERVMEYRRLRNLPLHSPPHWAMGFSAQYLVTAACYEHAPIVGENAERLTECEGKMLAACREHSSKIYAWCVLPNHYHVLVGKGVSRACAENSDGFTDNLPSDGMAKTTKEAERFGSDVSIARSGQNAIFGQL